MCLTKNPSFSVSNTYMFERLELKIEINHIFCIPQSCAVANKILSILDKGSSDRSETVDTIAWHPHGNESSVGDPSSRATAIAALLEKHEKKGSGNTPRNVSSCTVTKPSDIKCREDLAKPVSIGYCPTNGISYTKATTLGLATLDKE